VTTGTVIQILTLIAGLTGIVTVVLKFGTDWRGQSHSKRASNSEREAKMRDQIQELEDEVAEQRRRIRAAESLTDSQASAIAMDTQKLVLAGEEIKWLRRRLRELEGTPDEQST
jgi:hypothetical protein